MPVSLKETLASADTPADVYLAMEVGREGRGIPGSWCHLHGLESIQEYDINFTAYSYKHKLLACLSLPVFAVRSTPNMKLSILVHPKKFRVTS